MRFGVVFAGGFANGAFQLGFCKAYNDWFRDSRPDLVCGTSIGAWNAYILAGEPNIDGVFASWLTINESNPLKVRNKLFKTSFLSDITNNYVREIEPNKTDIYITAYNTTHKKIEAHLLNNKHVEYKKTFLKASVSVPKLAKPITFSGNNYSDAFMKVNIPLGILDNENLDYAFCIYFDQTFIPHHPTVKLIPICMKPNSLFSIKHMDFSHRTLLNNFNQGYSSSLQIFSKLFPFHSLSEINESAYIDFMNSTKTNFYLSPDMIVDHLNHYSSHINITKL